MSVLEFFDVFRMFLGELDNRNYGPQQRQDTLHGVIESLKNVLVQVDQMNVGAGANPFANGGGYQAPPVHQQPQYQQPPQPQQHYQPPPTPQQHYQPPPTPQYQEPVHHQAPQQHQPQAQAPQPQQQYQQPQQPQQQEYGYDPNQNQGGYQEDLNSTHQSMQSLNMADQAPAGPDGDAEALSLISSVVYGTNLRLQQVYKTMNSDGDGVKDNQLIEGIHKLGAKIDPAVILRIAEPFKVKGKLPYSGFIRMLASGDN